MRHGIENSMEGIKAVLRVISVVLMMVSPGPLAGAQVAPAPDEANEIPVADAEITQLIEQLGSKDKEIDSNAFQNLLRIKSQAIPELLEVLANSNSQSEKRARAAQVLGYGQPGVIRAIPTFVEILEDRAQAPKLRNSVARALTYTIMNNKTDQMLSSAPEKVARPDTATLLPVLVGLLEDSSEEMEIRSNAAFALGEIGPGAVQALPTLLASIRDSESRVRAASVSALGDIGIALPEVIPVLIRGLQDEDESVRDWATHALGQHESKSDAIVAALRQALEDASATIRQSAVMALATIGPEPKGVVPGLIFALRDEHDWVRGEAAAALGKVGPVTPEVADQDPIVKWYSARALGSLGSEARDAITALSQAILADDRRNESHIIEPDIVAALRAIGADMASVVPPLETALSSENEDTRERAARALGAIGAEGLPALAAALAALGGSEDHEVRWALSFIEYPLDTTPNLSLEGLQALIHHYISERDRQAASTPDEPDRWADEQDALLYLAKLEREQKASALAVAREAANVEKFPLPPTLLAFVAPILVVLMLLALRLHRRSRSSSGL
jgi:HEAT repeat protein